MNRMDIDFWNGILKGAITMKCEIEDTMEKASEDLLPGLKVALRLIEEFEASTERLHGEDIREFLRKYRPS